VPAQNRAFFVWISQRRPRITLKVAATLDGFIAPASPNGKINWITGPAARQVAHELRVAHDAILVGAGTVLADDPQLTARGVPGASPDRPLRVILDGRLRTPPTARILKTGGAAPLVIGAHGRRADPAMGARIRRLERAGAQVLLLPAGADGHIPLPRILRALAGRQVQSLLVEGGQPRARRLHRRAPGGRGGLVPGAPACGSGGVDRTRGRPRLAVPRRAGAAHDAHRRQRPAGHRRCRRAAGPPLRPEGNRKKATVFTGIVEGIGKIETLRPLPGGSRRIAVSTALEVGKLPLGASIAVNGVCLTVVARKARRFEADVGPETLRVTTFGDRGAGDRVHLERPLRLGDPLGGHLVAGHVDGVGKIKARRKHGDALGLRISVPRELAPLLAPKGSVTVDGVSLTINDVDGVEFAVMLIPHTLVATCLGERKTGDRVNIETDLIAKHVARLVKPHVR
jgi:riboflavin synthase